MAIFGKKKEETTKAAATTKAAPASSNIKDVTWAVKEPRITEKAAILAETGVYVFNIDTRATKADVARAIFDAYKVTPVRVNIVAAPGKTMIKKKRAGVTRGIASGDKKAYVTLKKGDTIQFV